MAIARRTSQKQVSGTASSSQKRRITYISSNDPRAKDPVYLNKMAGQIQILEPEEYAKWLRIQLADAGSGDEDIPVSGSLSIEDFGLLLTSFDPPTNLVYDTSNSDSTIYTSDPNGNSYVNLEISFDPSIDDTNDGSIEYLVNYVLTAGDTGTGTDANAQNTSGSAKNIATVTANQSTLSISWDMVANAQSYSITVNGANLPGSFGQLKKTYSDLSSLNNSSSGRHTFSLNQSDHYGYGTSPSVFSGTYTFLISTVYQNNTSSNVGSHSVTV